MDFLRNLFSTIIGIIATIGFFILIFIFIAGFAEGKDGAGYYLLYAFGAIGLGVFLTEAIKPKDQ